MAGEKTEQPTPRRRLKAREQGQVPRSRELSSALATLAALFVFAWQIEKVPANWSQYTRHALALATTADIRLETELLPRTIWLAMRWSAAPMGAAWFTAAVVSLAQGGILFAPASLAFNPSRLSPAAKLKQMFSFTGLSSLLKSLLPTGFILYLAARVIARDWPLLLRGAGWNSRQFASFLLGRVFEISWKAMLVLLIWSALDYLLVRQKHESGMKMSRDELREEMKQTEGNPQIKMRIRRLQRQVRRRQMLQDVQRATVVVTNPTHFAVALEYGPEHGGPHGGGQRAQPAGAADQAGRALAWHRHHGEPAAGARPLSRGEDRAGDSGKALCRGGGDSGVRLSACRRRRRGRGCRPWQIRNRRSRVRAGRRLGGSGCRRGHGVRHAGAAARHFARPAAGPQHHRFGPGAAGGRAILRPVQFSVFPSLLLLLTLFRLSLNLAASRRILLHGNEGAAAAGSVIEAFGQFVVGGNYVVGFVLFLALIAIQFMVVSHGAVRTAEVTARFTLDAMPGKQMAIDADLNAGTDRRGAGPRPPRSRLRTRPNSTAPWTAPPASASAIRWPPS